MKWNYKERKSFDERLKESNAIRKRNPHAIPVIAVKASDYKLSGPDIVKFIVSQDYTFSQLTLIIRSKVKLEHGQTLFFLINNTMPMFSATLGELYTSEADSDGFLYVNFDLESAFG